ncbi:hypothetical protein [Paraburkholderia humisilvae]|uniref:Uncharacterized protein n=1 Tax=Paraburkholderia humisilvae TaxID=627669 RepID=A0A6J5F5Y4_9BURK|nr:hypothetical protein [Paraburkholderia humisilvae]CAB3774238.1 hypothetical protein LMG29542_07660 [Paraburkholderia humisilvae]
MFEMVFGVDSSDDLDLSYPDELLQRAEAYICRYRASPPLVDYLCERKRSIGHCELPVSGVRLDAVHRCQLHSPEHSAVLSAECQRRGLNYWRRDSVPHAADDRAGAPQSTTASLPAAHGRQQITNPSGSSTSRRHANLFDDACSPWAASYDRQDEFVKRSLKVYVGWSGAKIRLFHQVAAARDVVVEAESSIDSHTMWFLPVMGEMVRAIAYKPQRHVDRVLCPKHALNGHLDVDTRREALDRTDGHLEIAIARAHENFNFGAISCHTPRQRNGAALGQRLAHARSTEFFEGGHQELPDRDAARRETDPSSDIGPRFSWNLSSSTDREISRRRLAS